MGQAVITILKNGWAALAALIVTAGFVFAAPDPQYWQERERACKGNFAQMLAELRQAPPIPQLRTDWSAEQLFRLLQRIGRFRQLGVTDAEGKILVQAFFERMGIQPHARPAASASDPAEADGELVTYRAGTEFEHLDAVLMRWPTETFSWQASWGQMIAALGEAGVTVYLWTNNPINAALADLYLSLKKIPSAHVVSVVSRTDSVWMRDYGPQFVYDTADSDWGVVDFHYYPGRALDDRTPALVAGYRGVPLIDRQTEQVVYTEGGNLNHDGLGCVVYSRRTYERNPGVPEDVIDQRILTAFQANRAIVPEAPALDGTGHVDMFLKIIGPDTVLVGQYAPDQVDYQTLEACAELFENSTNGEGKLWHVVRIPQPNVYFYSFIWPVVRTYTNSLIANSQVLVPVYNIPQDQEALAIYQNLMADRTIRPLDATGIISSGGAWHCVTMEVPGPDQP